MGLGTVLAVLALLFLRPHIGSVGGMLSGESGVPGVAVTFVLTQIAAALAVALWGVVAIIMGLREMIGFAVPPDAPGGLRDPADAAEQLRQEKLNAYAAAASGWFRLVLSFFSARAAFLSPTPRKIARQRLRIALWMLLVVVLAAVIGLGPRVMGLHALAVIPAPPGLFFGIFLLLVVFDIAAVF